MENKLKNLSKESQDFYSALNNENDYVCVLLSINYLDQILFSILHNHFKKGKTTDFLLKQEGGVLGTFFNRTAISYCLNLISKNTKSNFQTLGEIRNIFAHNYLITTFDTPKIKEKCAKLILPDICNEIILDKSLLSNRDKFSFVVVLTAQNLMV